MFACRSSSRQLAPFLGVILPKWRPCLSLIIIFLYHKAKLNKWTNKPTLNDCARTGIHTRLTTYDIRPLTTDTRLDRDFHQVICIERLHTAYDSYTTYDVRFTTYINLRHTIHNSKPVIKINWNHLTRYSCKIGKCFWIKKVHLFEVRLVNIWFTGCICLTITWFEITDFVVVQIRTRYPFMHWLDYDVTTTDLFSRAARDWTWCPWRPSRDLTIYSSWGENKSI